MRGLRIRADGRPLSLLLLAFWVVGTGSTLQPQCDTYVDTYDEVTRLNGNAVQGYVETSLWGPCKDYWLPGVPGWVYKDSQGIQTGGPVWGEYAGGWVGWEFTAVTLSASGPRTYSAIGFHFAYCASCDGGWGRYVPPYDDNWDGYDGRQLFVQRPTISGLHGAWYFGPNFVPNNGYYDATRLTADPKYPDPETEPYWIITANPSKIDLTCTHCTATDAYSKGDTCPFSNPDNRVKVKVSVGGPSGFMSDEHYLELDTPHRLVQESVNDVGLTNPIGFLSYVTLHLWSKCGQKMFDIAMNEEFTGSGSDMTNDWGGAPQPNNWSHMDGYTFTDGIGFACSGCTPAPEQPGPLQTPPKSLSSTKVKGNAQKFRSGSDTSGSGVLVQTDTQQLYIDHGRHENVTSPVN